MSIRSLKLVRPPHLPTYLTWRGGSSLQCRHSCRHSPAFNTSMRLISIILLAFSATAFGQQPVSVRVDASQKTGTLKPVWKYFGYDEPNYTYAKNGRKLIGELASLS
jgi:hypothetical protein